MGINIEGNKIVIANDYIYREIHIENGPSTTVFKLRPNGKRLGDVWYPVFAFESSVPFEAAVSINGKVYEAGPWKHELDWDREGAFTVTNVEKEKGSLGDILRLYCTGRSSEVPGVELIIEYELADDMPLLSKCVKVKNISDLDMIVDNVAVDILRYFEGKISLSTFSNYYWDVKKEDDYYVPWTRIEFPEKICMKLKPGEEFETFKFYEAVTSSDKDEEAIILHRIYKKLAPWITKAYVKQIVNSCNSYQELIDFADRASEDGIEEVELFLGQLFTNTGDYILRPDIFPNGDADLKKLVEYYHTKNIIVLPYCSTTIAWHNSEVCKQHPDWQYLGPDGIRYSPGGLGNMCYQSPWGDYISKKLLYLLDEIGFDGLALDGPYHGLPCLDKNHKHDNPETVKFMNWMWEKEFFGEVVKRNKIITSPQEWNSLLLGTKERPGGYREEDQQVMGGMPLVVMSRSCLYNGRYKDPSCATWASCNLELYHGHSIEASEENIATYDHALGSMFGYGHGGALYSKVPYIGDNTKKIFDKWVNFFKKYRQTLAGETVHIAKPNGFEPDAVLHVSLQSEIPALLVIFNPVGEKQEVSLELPLKYAGFKGMDTAVIEGHGKTTLDSRGHCTLDVSLEPYEIKKLEIKAGN